MKNTSTIRIEQKDKDEIDRLINERIRDIFEKGLTKESKRIYCTGISYADFIKDLILSYKEHKNKPETL